jgi:hypothetical protein
MSLHNLIIVGYARSGVTVLNRCLSSDKRLICLSEINTKYICPTLQNSPHQQAKDWYNLEIKNAETVDEISELLKYSEGHTKSLIIRDWSFGSFVPSRYNNFTPSNTLNTIDDLTDKFPETFNIVCIVRNPVDVWLSMRYSERTFYDKHLDYLLKFTEDILKRKIKIVKYEDFCKEPQKVLKDIYSSINMEQPQNIKLSDNVTGDINFPLSSRGSGYDNVRSLERRDYTEKDRLLLKRDTRVDQICNLLGYERV